MKFLKSFAMLTLCFCLTACQPADTFQSLETPVTVKVTHEITQPVVTEANLSFYEKYPELSETDIFSQHYQRAEEIVNNMTVEQKAGQMFLIRCPQDTEKAIEDIKLYNPGGYILFANHFENQTPYTIQTMTGEFQSNSAYPMAIACDEEGGDVVRISNIKTFRYEPFLSPQMVYQKGGFEEIKKDTISKSEFLKNLGINMNLAPVADISENPVDYIYSRSFGKNAEQTAQYIKTSVRAYNESNLTCVLKHFPGYGSNDDTHTNASLDERTLRTFEQNDFIPFIEGIKSNAPCIMVNHNTIIDIDMDNPASVSAEVHKILRQNLGFSGIAMTDDLEMSAITDNFSEVDACLKAVEAGNDIICTSAYEMGIPAVVTAAKTGKISEQRINTSVIRIIAWKLHYGIIE